MVRTVLQGNHAVLMQPTEGICFQLPPIVCGGMALVIAPTLSLIQDQVHDLHSKGIPATFLCSTQRDHTIAIGISAGEYKVVYMTPERLFPGGGQPDNFFQPLATKGKICLIAADEVHCIFTWELFRYAFVKKSMTYACSRLRRTKGSVDAFSSSQVICEPTASVPIWSLL